VVRVWAHEVPVRAAARISRIIEKRRSVAVPAARPRPPKGRAKQVPAGQGALVRFEATESAANTTKTKTAEPAKKVSTRRTSR
jgi:hypothetical protein